MNINSSRLKKTQNTLIMVKPRLKTCLSLIHARKVSKGKLCEVQNLCEYPMCLPQAICCRHRTVGVSQSIIPRLESL